jgi:mannan endo-1,4-beta-mannosidase
VGDDYTNDPAQEAQGLNSVFASDTTTLAVVKAEVDRMSKVK